MKLRRIIQKMTSKNYVITIADIHFGATDNDQKLYDELENVFIPFLKEKIEDNKLDVLNFAGDLFHRVIDFNEEAGRLILKFMEEVLEITSKASVPVYIIRGTKSHDYSQLNMLKRYELTYSNFHIINTVTVVDVEGRNGNTIKTLYIPEEYPINFDNFYGEYVGDDLPDKIYDLIIGHGMMNYVFDNNYKSNFEMDIRSAPTWNADNLIRLSKGPVEFGHVHNQDVYKDTVYYTRSFSRFSFGDKGTKGFLYTELDTETGEFNVEQVINHEAPTFVTINVDDIKAESSEEKIKLINEIRAENDHVRVVSTDKSETAFLKRITENDSSIKVTVRDKKVQERELDPDLEFLVNGSGSTEENIQRFINVSLKNEGKESSDILIDTIRDIINPKKEIVYSELLDKQSSVDK